MTRPRMGWRRFTFAASAFVVIASLAAAVLVVVVVVRQDGTDSGVTVVSSARLGDGAERTSTWGMITAGITADGVSKDVALEAFAYLHQIDIPGIVVPQGGVDGEVPTSGTAVREWALEHLDELTVDQRAAIEATVPDPHLVTTVVITPDATVITPPSSTGSGLRRLDAPPSTFVDAVAAQSRDLLHKMGVRLGVPMLSNGYPDVASLSGNGTTLDAVTVGFSPTASGFDLMETNNLTDSRTGIASACNITIYPMSWNPEASNQTLSNNFLAELAHEIVHCYQRLVRPGSLPPWIGEGTATWAATNLLGFAEPTTADWFGIGWIGRHRNSVETRTYDAVGFWSLAADSAVDVWGNLMAIFADGSTPFALKTMRAADDNVVTRWSTHDFRRPDWGTQWEVGGVGVPSGVLPAIQAPTIIQGGTFTDYREPNSVEMYSFTVNDEVVEFAAPFGTMSVHDGKGISIEGFQRANFCLVESCVCPAGTPRAGEDIASVKLSQPIALGLAGNTGGTTMSGRAMRLTTACGSPPPRTAVVPGTPSPPCGASCARSNGDPHLTTVTGAPYDFQAAGEYVLLRAPDDSFEIQARQQQYETLTAVAINTAVVIAASTHRIQAEVADTTVTVTVDGSPFGPTGSIATPSDLGNGVRVGRTDRAISVELPDGTVAYLITSNPHYGIQVEVLPSDAVIGGGVGLLGVGDRLAALRLPALPDGTQPIGDTRRDAIYGSLGPAWMVTPTSTKFTYSDGESPASFIRTDFPDFPSLRAPDELTVEERTAATPACGSISDQAVRDACTFDVSVTGDSGFSAPYSVIDELGIDGGSLDDPVPGGSTSGSTSELPTAPQIAGLVDVITGASSAKDMVLNGDQAFVTVALADSSAVLVAIDLTTRSVTSTTPVPSAGRLAVVAGSLWVDETDGDTCTVTRRSLDDLSVQATLHPLTCFFGVQLAPGGDQLWVLDSARGADGLLVPVAIPVDPSDNTFASPISLPDDATSIIHGGAAGVVISGTAPVFIPAGAPTTITRLPVTTQSMAVGDEGIWTEDDRGISLLAADGSVVADFADLYGLRGASDTSAFAAITTNDGADVLVELTATGSQSILAEAPTDELADGSTLSFFTDLPFAADTTWAVQLWYVPDGDKRTIRALIIPRG